MNFNGLRRCTSALRWMFIAFLAVLAALFWQWDAVHTLYFQNSLVIGYMMNAGIICLFLAGFWHIAVLLRFYRKEFAALELVQDALARGDRSAIDRVSGHLVSERFNALNALYLAHADMDHAALAASLQARLSTELSLPRFVSNTLILSGVFGTVVSLSIALIGASDVLQTSLSSGGMGMIIHGMSTALSTTISAIVCYVLFAYAYGKVKDMQTLYASQLETMTLQQFLPLFVRNDEAVCSRTEQLIEYLEALAGKMQDCHAAQQQWPELIAKHDAALDQYAKQLSSIESVLRKGFRLSSNDVS